MRELLHTAIVLFSNLLTFLIFVRVILSWFPRPRRDGLLLQLYQGLMRIAHLMTDPIIGPIRNLLRNSPLGGPGMMLDFSPIIAFLLIGFVRGILINLVWIIF